MNLKHFSTKRIALLFFRMHLPLKLSHVFKFCTVKTKNLMQYNHNDIIFKAFQTTGIDIKAHTL